MILDRNKLIGLLVLTIIGFSLSSSAQEESEFKDTKSALWFNTYGNIRIAKRYFWDAQTHFRFEETSDVPFVGQVAQIYNRHAIGYIVSKKFDVRLGGVLRINFNTDEDSTDRSVVPEWRIWHQYQWAIPISSVMIYHRIRIEHRWTQGFAENSEYIFRNRWRYMFRMKIPINKPRFEPETFYIGPEAELIMQSGKPVVGSPMEDLRLTTTIGYILTPRLTFAAGAMYSLGQNLEDGTIYQPKWTLRFHMYYSPDFRKVKNKLPAIHLDD